MRASLTDLAKIKEHGYRLDRWGEGWTLTHISDPEAHLFIGEQGCVAPRQADAVIEALHRIEMDERLSTL